MDKAKDKEKDKAQPTLMGAFRDRLREHMLEDPSILVLGTDLFARGGNFGQVAGLGQEFGEGRIRNAPIAEAAMVAAGLGAALNGLRPMVDLNFVDFALSAMDELVNQVAKARYMWGADVPLIVRASYGVAGYGPQHNNSMEALFAHTPGLVVAVPSCPADAAGLLTSALTGSDPVIFLMHKRLSPLRGEPPAPASGGGVPFGSARVVREGSDVTLVGYSIMVPTAQKVAASLADEGVSAEVIDLRTLAPLDVDTVVRSVRKTGALVVASEAPWLGSFASEVAASVQERCFDSLRTAIRRVTSAHSPIPHSPTLIQGIVATDEHLLAAARSAAKAGREVPA